MLGMNRARIHAGDRFEKVADGQKVDRCLCTYMVEGARDVFFGAIPPRAPCTEKYFFAL